MTVDLVPARRVHVGPIASRMRAVDRLECEAFGRSPRQALRLGLSSSLICMTAMVGGRAEAMFGLSPVSLIEGVGCPWFLGTDVVYRHGRDMLALGPRVIAVFRDSCPVLEQLCSAGNGRALRLLRRWGFTVGDDVRMIGGTAFHPFAMGV